MISAFINAPLTGHTQYLSTIVKDNFAECRRDFGVQFLLDMIRVFYRYHSAQFCVSYLCDYMSHTSMIPYLIPP